MSDGFKMKELSNYLKNIENVKSELKRKSQKGFFKTTPPVKTETVQNGQNNDINNDKRLEELNNLLNSRIDYFDANLKNTANELKSLLSELLEFSKELKNGEWIEKGDPVEYFENITSLETLANSFGKLKSSVDEIYDTQEEIKEEKN